VQGVTRRHAGANGSADYASAFARSATADGVANPPYELVHLSSVNICVRFRIAGAANNTTGSIVIQATRKDCSQWLIKDPSADYAEFIIGRAFARPVG